MRICARACLAYCLLVGITFGTWFAFARRIVKDIVMELGEVVKDVHASMMMTVKQQKKVRATYGRGSVLAWIKSCRVALIQ